jgi:hypothetical protein
VLARPPPRPGHIVERADVVQIIFLCDYLLVQKVAPEGKVWVCPACGRHAKNVDDLGDTACVTAAVLCWERHPGEDKWQMAEEAPPTAK